MKKKIVLLSTMQIFIILVYKSCYLYTILSNLERSSNEILYDGFPGNLNKYSVSVNIFNINSVTTIANFYVTNVYVNILVT
jgi:hypothetical protein